MNKDKGKYDVEASAALLRDNSENPARLISVVRDITERKRMEEMLRASEALYRLLVDSAPNAILRTSHDTVDARRGGMRLQAVIPVV